MSLLASILIKSIEFLGQGQVKLAWTYFHATWLAERQLNSRAHVSSGS